MDLTKISSPGISQEEESGSSYEKTSLFQKIIYSCLFLIACLFIFSLFHRDLHIDEAILGEHAYWLAKIGKVKANMYAGTGVGWENELLVYHKLFIWYGAGVISLFGLSLPALRVSILIFGGIICVLLYFYCKNFAEVQKKNSFTLYLLSLFLLSINSFFFNYSFTFRPEIMQACLGFGSFYALISYLQKEKTRSLLMAALLAGLATVTHLNGLIFIGAGAVILFLNRKYQAAFLFGAVATAVSLLYFVNMIGDPGSWERFIWQFKGDPAIEKTDLSITDRIFRLFEEHKRYLHSQVEGSFTILLLISLIVKGKYLWHNHKNLLLYPLLCSFFLACISQGLTSKYAILFLPQAVLIVAISLYSFLTNPVQKKKTLLTGALLLVYAGIQVHHIVIKFTDKSIEERNAHIAKNIPENSHVYASIPFFFNEVEHFRISSSMAFDLLVYRYNKLELSKEDFFKHVHSLGAEYIVFDLLFEDKSMQTVLNTLKKKNFKVGSPHYGFEVVRNEKDYILLKRQQGF